AHSLALRSNRSLWAWGKNTDGQLGDGTTTNADVPRAVSGLSAVTALAAGGSFSLAVGSGPDNSANSPGVAAWGEGGSGQLGNGKDAPSNVAVKTINLTDVLAVAAG